MLYKYTVSTQEGETKTGTIEAASLEIAINSLQRRNLVIISVNPAEKAENVFSTKIKFFERVKTRDIVILSRQMSTLFEAKISTLDSFRLLASEMESPVLRRVLGEVTEDIQAGISISQALGKHPEVFSKFYVSMVKAGEESGKLDEAFLYIADYLERYYELTSKVRGALVYPAFVIIAFFAVIVLMMVVVVPKLTAILKEAGQDIPAYTKIVIAFSDFFINFGVFILLGIVAGIVLLWNYYKTEAGKQAVSGFQLSAPIIGPLFKKFYVSRMLDNLYTLLSGGISAVTALESTAEVVGSSVYRSILLEAARNVQTGTAISDSLSRYHEIPGLVIQMLKIGEQSGKLDYILKTLSRFYKKEVDNAVDVIVSLIEPMLIMVLGITVAVLFVAILSPIYNIGANI